MAKTARTAIIGTFKELMCKQPIDKLTVTEICARSYVNRHTFYYYFTDIMDIFKYIIFEELSEEIAHNKTFDTWEAGFLATMNYLKRNSRIILNVYHSSFWPEANVYLSEMSNRLVRGVVKECIQKMSASITCKDMNFIIDFYRYVFNGWMLDWVKTGMEEKPDEILRKLLMMVTDMSCAVALFDGASKAEAVR
ncbi:MAG: TetR family transcriptional regulator [Clostridia bacterium]|nr:TetR family transcriptional regulator [Clostridia bacterium]